jgi:predicted YcjX-like family ATPase
LAHAVMPNGERYNGRFHLPGDIQDAQAAGFNPHDTTSMCRFYDIPRERYEQLSMVRNP